MDEFCWTTPEEVTAKIRDHEDYAAAARLAADTDALRSRLRSYRVQMCEHNSFYSTIAYAEGVGVGVPRAKIEARCDYCGGVARMELTANKQFNHRDLEWS